MGTWVSRHLKQSEPEYFTARVEDTKTLESALFILEVKQPFKGQRAILMDLWAAKGPSSWSSSYS